MEGVGVGRSREEEEEEEEGREMDAVMEEEEEEEEEEAVETGVEGVVHAPLMSRAPRAFRASTLDALHLLVRWEYILMRLQSL